MTNARLSIFGLGTAVGVTLALGLLIIGCFSMFGCAIPLVKAISSVFILYTSTLPGIIFGVIWGFICGFTQGALIALFYNLVCFGKS